MGDFLKQVWFVCFLFSSFANNAAEALKLTHTIPLPGVTGRFDHFAIDAPGKRLFVAALGNNTLEILDVSANKRLETIRGVRKPTGVAFFGDTERICVATGEDGALKIFSGKNYKIVASVTALDDADNVRRDARTGMIYVGYGCGALAVIDPTSFKHSSDVRLRGHPESFQIEEGGRRIFINVPDQKEVVVADRTESKVIGSWPMTKFQSNFPMALDETNQRLFIGCRNPPRLVVFDSEKGKEMADTEISGDTDDLFYDVKRERVYLSCGEGFIDVISSSPNERLKRVAKITTRSGARTSFFSRELDRLYLGVPKRGNESAELRIYEPEQP